MIYKKLTLIIASILCVCIGASAQKQYYTADEVPNVQMLNKHRYLSDPGKVIDAATTAHIDSVLEKMRYQAGVEAAAVVVPKMSKGDDMDIDTYATDLFKLWGLGNEKTNNGLLVVVSIGDRKYVIRTGYGVEEFLPDVICGRIERNVMRPAFKEGDYARGLGAAIDSLYSVASNPQLREQMLKQVQAEEREAWMSVLYMYIGFCVCLTIILLLWLLSAHSKTKGKTPYDKYKAMRTLKKVSGACAWIALGLPLFVYLPLRRAMNYWRNGARTCDNCGTEMQKLDEESDNAYLTPAQDAEERLKSVDYDVWLCPKCGNIEIYRFEENSGYSECPSCHAKTCRFIKDMVVQKPTQYSEGVGVKVYECLNCKKRHNITYKIAKLAAPVIIAGGGGSGGGGGFSGGGWGGGGTGGGGASGGW